jgi:hypothetical protein
VSVYMSMEQHSQAAGAAKAPWRTPPAAGAAAAPLPPLRPWRPAPPPLPQNAPLPARQGPWDSDCFKSFERECHSVETCTLQRLHFAVPHIYLDIAGRRWAAAHSAGIAGLGCIWLGERELKLCQETVISNVPSCAGVLVTGQLQDLPLATLLCSERSPSKPASRLSRWAILYHRCTHTTRLAF